MAVLQFAQKAFIEHEGALLLVRKSADDPERPGLWEVPGGRMEFGEELDAHLKREVAEEVGIDVDPGQAFAIWEWKMNGRRATEGQQVQVVAVARVCTPRSTELSAVGRLADDYLDDAEWVPVDEVLQRQLIPSLIPVVEAFLQQRSPGA